MYQFRTSRAVVFFGCLALVCVLGATGLHAQATKTSGTITAAISRADTVMVNDAQGHGMYLQAWKGTLASTGEQPFMDGAKVVIPALSDLVQGNGTHQGYTTFAMGADTVVASWHGKVTAVMGKDEKRLISFKGVFTYMRGTGQYMNIKGKGTYEGKFTSPKEFMCEVQGEYSLGE